MGDKSLSLRIRTNEGVVLLGASWDELVAALRTHSYQAPKQDKTYMAGVARRAKYLDGSTIRTNCARNFIYDLYNAGFLTEIEVLRFTKGHKTPLLRLVATDEDGEL